MSEKFKVEVVTPTGVVLDKMVEEVVAPGTMGEFGVLIGHTPMLTFIQPGVFSYLEDDRFIRFAVGSGFCEVLKDAVTVLVDEVHKAEDVDPGEAAAEVQSLEQQLLSTDMAADPEGYSSVQKKLKVARAKVSLVSHS